MFGGNSYGSYKILNIFLKNKLITIIDHVNFGEK